MKSMPAASAMRARRSVSGQAPDQRSGTLVTARPEEQLAPNSPILRALSLYMAMRSRIGESLSKSQFRVARLYGRMARMMRYGSRAKLGFLIPSVNLASECQFPAMAPPGVSLHFTRLKLVTANEDELRRMADGLEAAVELLKDAGVSSITFHCTAVTTFAPGMDEKLIQRIRQASGLPATATGRAAVMALNKFEAKKVVLVTPYPMHVNQKEEAFLRANG